MSKNISWIKNSIIYNTYPQSFMDTNGDGIGDLKGIEEKLDYIKSLGCNIVWLNPIFESPFRDAGYDVTDFYTVAPRYGTNEDLRSLCEAAKERDMHIVLDLVAGHTSLECEWFQRSAEYEPNEYTDRYVWTNEIGDLGDGTFINGYSDRNGSFMKNFYYCQPALNYGYANPQKDWQLPIDHPACIATQEALLDIMDHWCSHGVDGFRVDMAFSLVKGDPDQRVTMEVWKRMSRKFKEKHPDTLLISEWSYPERALACGFDLDFMIHFHMKPFTTLFRHEAGKNDRLDWVGPSYFRKAGEGDFALFYEDFIDQINKTKEFGYVSVPTGNHDLGRVSLERDMEDLKVIMTFLLTLPGIPLIYYGDEIGMRYLENLRSVEGGYRRTGSRSPMQWNSEKNYGFSTADTTYVPCDPSQDAPTVEAQLQDENSLLNHVKRMVEIRKAHPALQEDGEFTVVSKTSYPAVYERSLGDEIIRVIINPSTRTSVVEDVHVDEVYIAHNVAVDGTTATVGACSYMVYKTK